MWIVCRLLSRSGLYRLNLSLLILSHVDDSRFLVWLVDTHLFWMVEHGLWILRNLTIVHLIIPILYWRLIMLSWKVLLLSKLIRILRLLIVLLVLGIVLSYRNHRLQHLLLTLREHLELPLLIAHHDTQILLLNLILLFHHLEKASSKDLQSWVGIALMSWWLVCSLFDNPIFDRFFSSSCTLIHTSWYLLQPVPSRVSEKLVFQLLPEFYHAILEFFTVVDTMDQWLILMLSFLVKLIEFMLGFCEFLSSIFLKCRCFLSSFICQIETAIYEVIVVAVASVLENGCVHGIFEHLVECLHLICQLNYALGGFNPDHLLLNLFHVAHVCVLSEFQSNGLEVGEFCCCVDSVLRFEILEFLKWERCEDVLLVFLQRFMATY